jgi:Domain of unknown function (DUF1839)
MRLELLPIDAASYSSHALHSGGVDWAETNCATDMWIEILHSWGLDPVAGLAFTVGTDFDGEQWAMFTYPDEDLRVLYGIDVDELNVWRPLIEHVEDHLRLGHVVPVDVDAYHLPDTAGVTYRLAHQKTTVAVQMVDRERRALGYFHNAGYAELAGDDFDALFHLGPYADPMAVAMPPYAMVVRVGGLRRDPPDLVDRTVGRLRVHLERRPPDNPVLRLGERMADDLPAIATDGMDAFHRYAFGSCRHLGANGELAATFVDWLGRHDPTADGPALAEAATAYRTVSSGAKAAEFTVARAAAGRKVDLDAVVQPLAVAWDRAATILADRYST